MPWPISEVATPVSEVGLVGHSGPDLLTLGFSHFDPGCEKTACCCYDSPVILGGIDEALR